MIAENAALRNSVTASQCERILEWLNAGNSLTPLEALDKFGCNRLGARIYDLKDRGHVITSRLVPVINRDGGTCRVAQYSLVQADAVQDGAV